MLTFSPHPSTSLSFFDREETGSYMSTPHSLNSSKFQDGRRKSAMLRNSFFFVGGVAFFVTSESGLKKANLFVFYVGVASYRSKSLGTLKHHKIICFAEAELTNMQSVYNFDRFRFSSRC